MGKIIVRTGRGSRTFAAADNAFSDFINESILDEMIKGTEDERVEVIGKLGRDIEKNIERSVSKLMPFVTQSLIGRLQTSRGADSSGITIGARDLEGADTGVSPFESRFGQLSGRNTHFNFEQFQTGLINSSVFWPRLTPATIRKKTQNKIKYFLHTGELRAELNLLSPSLVAILGGAKIQYKRVKPANLAHTNTNIRVGQITIKLAPKINSHMVPGLRSGRWSDSDTKLPLERRLGLSPLSLEKLRGGLQTGSGRIVHRPLLQPIVAFWILFRIPGVIRKALKDTLG